MSCVFALASSMILVLVKSIPKYINGTLPSLKKSLKVWAIEDCPKKTRKVDNQMSRRGLFFCFIIRNLLLIGNKDFHFTSRHFHFIAIDRAAYDHYFKDLIFYGNIGYNFIIYFGQAQNLHVLNCTNVSNGRGLPVFLGKISLPRCRRLGNMLKQSGFSQFSIPDKNIFFLYEQTGFASMIISC